MNKAFGIDTISHSDEIYLEALAEAYHNASSWDTRRQALSIMAGVGSFNDISRYVPGSLRSKRFRGVSEQISMFCSRPNFRAAKASKFVRKPHGNACYAGYVPGLTKCRYSMANLHKSQVGRGAQVPKTSTTRIQVDLRKLNHFLDFITSAHLIQDLSCGDVIEVPNVIRLMIPQRVVQQYTQ